MSLKHKERFRDWVGGLGQSFQVEEIAAANAERCKRKKATVAAGVCKRDSLNATLESVEGGDRELLEW